MKYFLLSTELERNPLPQITNWFEQINPRDITPDRAGNIPDWLQLQVSNGLEAVFSDVLSMPGYLVSTAVYSAMKLYDPYMKQKQVVLFDRQAQIMHLYHLPILPVCDCLLPESKLSRDKTEILYGVLDVEKAGRRPFVKLGGTAKTQVAFRLDVVESILRRGAKGLRIMELEVREDMRYGNSST